MFKIITTQLFLSLKPTTSLMIEESNSHSIGPSLSSLPIPFYGKSLEHDSEGCVSSEGSGEREPLHLASIQAVECDIYNDNTLEKEASSIL